METINNLLINLNQEVSAMQKNCARPRTKASQTPLDLGARNILLRALVDSPIDFICEVSNY